MNDEAIPQQYRAPDTHTKFEHKGENLSFAFDSRTAQTSVFDETGYPFLEVPGEHPEDIMRCFVWAYEQGIKEGFERGFRRAQDAIKTAIGF